MTSPTPAASLKQAAGLARHLTEQFEKDPAFMDALEKHASAATKDKVMQITKNLIQCIFDVAAAPTPEAKERAATVYYNGAIGLAELMAETVTKQETALAQELDDFFAATAKTPGSVNYTKAFQDAGAPVLAASSRKAWPQKKKPKPKKGPSHKKHR